MDHWDIAATRAAASRERSAAVHALIAQFVAWLRTAAGARRPRARMHECLGTGH